jgi:hypothetical protein
MHVHGDVRRSVTVSVVWALIHGLKQAAWCINSLCTRPASHRRPHLSKRAKNSKILCSWLELERNLACEGLSTIPAVHKPSCVNVSVPAADSFHVHTPTSSQSAPKIEKRLFTTSHDLYEHGHDGQADHSCAQAGPVGSYGASLAQPCTLHIGVCSVGAEDNVLCPSRENFCQVDFQVAQSR